MRVKTVSSAGFKFWPNNAWEKRPWLWLADPGSCKQRAHSSRSGNGAGATASQGAPRSAVQPLRRVSAGLSWLRLSRPPDSAHPLQRALLMAGAPRGYTPQLRGPWARNQAHVRPTGPGLVPRSAYAPRATFRFCFVFFFKSELISKPDG